MAEITSENHLEFNNTDGGLFCSYVNTNNAKVAASLRRIFPNHGVGYTQSIELIMSGKLNGSIICQTPKVFSISCGELPSGETVDQAGVSGVWTAKNGDIVLHAPHGTVKIIANNIELTSTGNPSRGKGHVSISASGDLRGKTNSITLEAADKTRISGEDEVQISATNKVLVRGELKTEEGHDIGTLISTYGSGSMTPKQFAEAILKLTDIK
jgi:hypothetical protein